MKGEVHQRNWAPGLKKAFSECPISPWSVSFICKRALHTPKFLDSKILHNNFPTQGLNSSTGEAPSGGAFVTGLHSVSDTPRVCRSNLYRTNISHHPYFSRPTPPTPPSKLFSLLLASIKLPPLSTQPFSKDQLRGIPCPTSTYCLPYPQSTLYLILSRWHRFKPSCPQIH